MTLFAFTVAAFGPFLTAYFSRFERRKLFISVLILFGLANAVAALAPNIWVMAFARLVPALGLPVFWALASETAVDIVGPDYAVAPSPRSASASSAPRCSAFRWAR
ncbi:Purine efflux pump PbuE [compost metagenome]